MGLHQYGQSLQNMFSSCQECTLKCCKVGPGPWTPKPFEIFYEEAPTYKGYNTMCEKWDKETGNCTVWDKPEELPFECKIFVCQNRTYTKEELSKIKGIVKRYEKEHGELVYS